MMHNKCFPRLSLGLWKSPFCTVLELIMEGSLDLEEKKKETFNIIKINY